MKEINACVEVLHSVKEGCIDHSKGTCLKYTEPCIERQF